MIKGNNNNKEEEKWDVTNQEKITIPNMTYRSLTF